MSLENNSLLLAPDSIEALVTGLSVLSLAVATIFGGIWKGLKEAREMTDKHGNHFRLPEDPNKSLVEAIDRLIDAKEDLIDVIKNLTHQLRAATEVVSDSRNTTRSLNEELHRSRAATVDLVEQLRRPRI